MPRQRATRRPKIFGDEAAFKRALVRYVNRGGDLVGQAESVRVRVARAEAKDGPDSLEAFIAHDEWSADVRRFSGNVKNFMDRHLEDAEKVLPVAMTLSSPETGRRRGISLGNGEPWLRAAVAELEELRARLGVTRRVAGVAAPPGRFEELRVSGLVDRAVVDATAGDTERLRTPAQRADAIGAAKELVEATLRGALDRLGVTYDTRDHLPALMAKWHRAVEGVAPPSPADKNKLGKVQTGLGSLVTFTAEWRNAYGRGHGRTKHPPGLKPRHARLAVDAAEAAVRFIVTTLDDLGMLPP